MNGGEKRSTVIGRGRKEWGVGGSFRVVVVKEKVHDVAENLVGPGEKEKRVRGGEREGTEPEKKKRNRWSGRERQGKDLRCFWRVRGESSEKKKGGRPVFLCLQRGKGGAERRPISRQ